MLSNSCPEGHVYPQKVGQFMVNIAVNTSAGF